MDTTSRCENVTLHVSFRTILVCCLLQSVTMFLVYLGCSVAMLKNETFNSTYSGKSEHTLRFLPKEPHEITRILVLVVNYEKQEVQANISTQHHCWPEETIDILKRTLIWLSFPMGKLFRNFWTAFGLWTNVVTASKNALCSSIEHWSNLWPYVLFPIFSRPGWAPLHLNSKQSLSLANIALLRSLFSFHDVRAVMRLVHGSSAVNTG